MRAIQTLLNSLLIFAVAFSPMAKADEASAHSTLIAHSPEIVRPDLKIDTTIETLDANDVEGKLAKAIADEPAGSITVISTDVDSVIEQSAKSKVVLIPFGRAIKKSADLVGGLNSYIRNYPAYAKTVWREDKITLGLTIFALGNETVRWLHVSDASTFQITANIMYSTLWAAAFLDGDTWSRATRPIQTKWRKLFKMSLVIPEHTSPSDFGIKFLSNLTLSVSLNMGRAAIVGIDQFARHALDPLHIAVPIFMGIAMTSVGFSWSEFRGSISKEMYPRAKRIVRLAANSRSIIMSLWASSAMLMNPNMFGWRPWVIVSISGTLGAYAFVNAPSIIPRLEQTAKRMQRSLPGYKPKTCEALF